MTIRRLAQAKDAGVKLKNGRGRPTVYQPELGEQIEEAMAGGLSADAAAAIIGISARSLFSWQKSHPEFMQSIQEGRIRALLWWETLALEMARGAPGNTQIVVLALKNRSRAASGWHDSVKLEHSGTNGAQVQTERKKILDVSALTWEQREQLEQLLLMAGAVMPRTPKSRFGKS